MASDSTSAVVYAADDKYALPVAVSGRSVQENVADPTQLAWYVLDMGLSEASKRRIVASWPQAGRVEFPPVSRDALRGLPSGRAENLFFPVEVFGFLLAPPILRDRHRRLLCLDADTLAVGDVSPLLDLSLDGHPFGAARDWAFDGTTIRSTSIKYSPERQLNSGVLVIDSDAWCREDVTGRVFEFARRHDDLQLPDQDALNAVMRQQWRDIGFEWNFQVARTTVREYRGPLPTILHFSGLRKPWLGRSALPHFLRLYRAYARRTAFGDAIPPETGYPSYAEDDGR